MPRFKKHKWRLYVDNDVEREIVEHLRQSDSDVLWVAESNKLSRRDDAFHYGEAKKLRRLVTQEPRIASLIAEGDVRTIRLGYREFESMLRERPGIAIAVIRVLANRLAEDGRVNE